MESLMDRTIVNEITTRFQALASMVPLAIHNATDYDRAIVLLNQLLDSGAADETSPLADLVNALGAVIGEYEDMHHSKVDVPPIATLRFLMEQHQLSQSDLPAVGTQGVVSEILNGKRDLNIRQIKALAERFHVAPGLFI